MEKRDLIEVSEIIKSLNTKNIKIKVVDDNIELYSINNKLDEELRNKIRKNKKQLIQILQSSQSGFYKPIKVCEKKEYYQLSPAQNRLYFIWQLDQYSLNYNMTEAFPIYKIEIEELKNLFYKIIYKHDIFRTYFKTINNLSYQIISKHISNEIEYISCSLNNVKDEIIKFRKPFDLHNGPLVRLALIDIESDYNFIVIDMHHIISDGISMEILKKEFINILSNNESKNNKISYKDYSEWYYKYRTLGKLDSQLNYWKNVFLDNTPPLELPTDFKRPEHFNFKGKNIYIEIDNHLYRELKNLCHEYKISLSNLVFSLLNILFYIYTQQKDIIIGNIISGRNNHELSNVIGLFLNILPIKTHINAESKFKDFCSQVYQNIINAYNNQDISTDTIIRELNLEKNISRNPLFNITFVNHAQISGYESNETPFIDNEKLKKIRDFNKTTKFDMSFFMTERNDAVDIRLEYYDSIYSADNINRLAKHLLKLCEIIIENPNIKINDIQLLTPEDKFIINESNNTNVKSVVRKQIYELFEESVEKNSDRIGISYQDHSISYSKINEESNKIANYIINKRKEICPGSVIGVLMDRNHYSPIVLLGILKAGCAFLPLVTSIPENRIKTLLKDSSSNFVITQKKYLDLAERLLWDIESIKIILCIDDSTISYNSNTNNEIEINKELWNIVASNANDEITAGGWISSFTGKPFTKKEMSEYSENVYSKLAPLLNKKMRILEIGCSSGLTMYRISPYVCKYTGVDFSSKLIEYNKQRIKNENIANIELINCSADEIQHYVQGKFDLIIINSVIQSFPNHQYLRDVINQCITLIENNGYIFFGDIINLEQRTNLENKAKEYLDDETYNLKTDFSKELLLSKDYFHDLKNHYNEFTEYEITDKIFTIENELTLFRYDVLYKIEKNNTFKLSSSKLKEVNGRDEFMNLSIELKNINKEKNELAYIIYTSGSSGLPKGVLVNNDSVVNIINWVNKKYSVSPNDNLLFINSLGFDLSIYDIFGILSAGGKIHILDVSELKKPESIVESIYKYCITFWDSAPALLEQISSYLIANKDIKNCMRLFFLSGDWIPVSLPNKIREVFKHAQVISLGGATEATVWSNYYPIKNINPLWHSIPYGKPIDNSKYYILDKNLRECPIGICGDLYISGQCLSIGYLNAPELTNSKYIKDPVSKEILYFTGDLAKWNNDGNIIFLGRSDQQVKIRGFRIELGEIDHCLKQFDSIDETVILVRKNQLNENSIFVYFTAKDRINITKIRNYLADVLPDYMIPTYIFQLDSIPLSANGKIDKNLLPGFEDMMGNKIDQPSDTNEIELVRIFSEILNIEKNNIGINHDFFELGGHSLLATQLVSKIHKELNFKIPLSEIFIQRTIKNICQYINTEILTTELSDKEEFII